MRTAPDWDYWKDKNRLPLWQAICLWAGIEPHKEYCVSADRSELGAIKDYMEEMGYPQSEINEASIVGPGFLESDLEKRLNICLSHFPTPENFNSFLDNVLLVMLQPVALRRFVKWAVERHIGFPPEFGEIIPLPMPRTFSTDEKAKAVKVESRPADSSQSTAMLSKKLNKIIEIAKEQYADPENPPKQAYVASLLADALGAKNADNSNSIMRAIAAIIKPEEDDNKTC